MKTTVVDSIRAVLTKAGTVESEAKDYVRVPKGEKGAGQILGSVVRFTVSGDGLNTPFKRHYYKNKLAKLATAAGATVDFARRARKSGVNVVSVMLPSAAKAPEAAAEVEGATAE